MARKTARPKPSSNVMDANQVVAYNFRLAREQAGWTQDEVAERLEGPIGQRLKKASISSIERSVESDRRRVFSAQEVVAFAIAFDKPVVWFFIPPRPSGEWSTIRLEGTGRPLVDLLTLVLGRDDQMDDLKERLRVPFEATEGEDSFASQQAEAQLQDATIESLGFGPHAPWEHYLALRRNVLADHVKIEYTALEDFYDQMGELMTTYEEVKRRKELVADIPRRPFRNVSELVLGGHIYNALARDYQGISPRYDHGDLLGLAQRDDVPWESIIDTKNEDVKKAIQDLARAIDPAVKDFLAQTTDT